MLGLGRQVKIIAGAWFFKDHQIQADCGCLASAPPLYARISLQNNSENALIIFNPFFAANLQIVRMSFMWVPISLLLFSLFLFFGVTIIANQYITINSLISFSQKIFRFRYFYATIDTRKKRREQLHGNKLQKIETVKSDTLGRICDALGCQPGDIMENIPSTISEV